MIMYTVCPNIFLLDFLNFEKIRQIEVRAKMYTNNLFSRQKYFLKILLCQMRLFE